MDFSALYSQIVIMFLLMGVGVVCYKRGMITDEGSGQMSTFIMTFVTPCVIIHSFSRSFSADMLKQLIFSFVLCVLIFVVCIGLATVAFRQKITDYADKRMCTIFPNNGFMALPLLQALYGSDGVFIGSVNIVATNILLWTYGVWLLSRASGRSSGGVNWRKIVLNPGTIGFAVGLALFLTSYQPPQVIADAVSFLADLNTPLAMVVLGVFLAQSNLKEMVKDRSIYEVSLFRLVVIPIITIVILMIVMVILPFEPYISAVMMISFAMPCGVAASMLAQMCGTNYHYSSRVIAFSTLLSAVTMPVVLNLYQLLAM